LRQSFLRRTIWLCLTASFYLAAPAATAAQDLRYFSAEYRIYAGGILLSKVEVQLDVSPKTYRVSAHIAPAGLGHIASNSHVVATSYGELEAGQFVPTHLDLSWANDDGISASSMRYRDGAPVEFISGYTRPPNAQSDSQVDINSIGKGTTDPFVAMLAPLKTDKLIDACHGEQQIFDGRRHATLTLLAGREIAPSEHDYPSQIAALSCQVLWTPIAGYSRRSLERAAEFPPVEAHYGRIADTRFAAPLEMRGETRFGAVSIYAVQFFTETKVQNQPFDIADYAYDLEPEERDDD